MKILNFCFDHPVAVKVLFECVSDPALKHEIKFLRSDDQGCLEIPVEDLAEGSWKMMLEWNHEGRDFCMERHLELPAAVLT